MLQSERCLLITMGVLCFFVSTTSLVAAEESKNIWKATNIPFTAASTNMTLTFGTTLTEECSNFEISGKTPVGKEGHFEDQDNFPIGPPGFKECKPGSVVAGEVSWKMGLHSGALTELQQKHCEEGAKLATLSLEKDPLGEDDCVTIEIPHGGATITVAGVCTITTNASAVVGFLDDEWSLGMKIVKEGKEEKIVIEGARITISEQEVQIEKKGALCPAATVGKVKAHIVMTPGVTDDK